MVSPINTGGFDVTTMPHYTAPDPQLLARYSPAPLLQGAQTAQGIGKALQAIQVQPSETAKSIASNQLEAGELGPQGLGGQNPLAAFSIQHQDTKPLTTQEENSFDPDTGIVNKTTRMFATGADTSDPKNAVSTTTAVDQQPKIFQTGDLNVTNEGSGVTTSFFMPRDPSKPALSLDENGLWKPNDNAIPMKSDYVFQKNLMGRGAQANAAQGAIFMDLLQKAKTPDERTYYLKAIQDLQNGNEADADKNAALALKARGANKTSEDIQDKKDTTALAVAGEKDATSKDIAKTKAASDQQLALTKTLGADNMAKVKNLSDEAKAYETMAQKATDSDEKQQNMFQAMKRRAAIGKMLEDSINSPGGGSGTVPKGTDAGVAPPTPEQEQEVANNPQFKDSFIQRWGQAAYDKAMANKGGAFSQVPTGAGGMPQLSAIPQGT